MQYRFLFVDDEASRPDCAVTVREEPNLVERWLGKSEKEWTVYARQDGWRRADGTELKPWQLKRLCRLWEQHEAARGRGKCRTVKCAQSLDVVDETGQESFPASDPPSWTSSSA